ncbi:MAG TPA: metallophosphoesterase [Syntrophomonadaceae bacterium]|nr:metallophosphoesterase [Syntrophomonadaceae bacterium]
MKLLYLTDTHIRGNTPENRLDILSDTLKNKINEVVRIAEEHDVDYILHGGDFFDVASPSLAITGEFLELFRKFKVPIYAISGNHDLFGANIQTLPRTLLGFIARLGFINLLFPGEKTYLKKHDVCLQLTGQPYHYDIDVRPREIDYQVSKESADIAIHMVHGMLVNQKEFPGPHTLIDDILETKADITLSGHNHLGFGIIERAGKYFINPGALIRLSNHRKEMARKVGVTLINLEGKQIECKNIWLKSALPGEEVLDRSKAEDKASLNLKLERFTQEIKQAADLEKMNVRNIINEVINNLEDSEEVREEALRRIALVEESMVFKGGTYN